ncbi:MAG: class I SAM-dependent methyltransferase [Chloroflexi bacterium]|nr:class I SAM-dependent methyltransferase [Chloroflexota bacterium]
MSIYSGYAAVYDASGQLGFSLRMIGYLEELLERFPPPGKRWLDLACGTGTVGVSLARRGYQVTGIDGSEQMLAEARRKAEAAGVEAIWMQHDMREFTLPERCNVATCLYDSLNYMLTSDDLSAVFGQVARALTRGGLFFFDMNTAFALETFWGGQAYFDDQGDLAVAFNTRYSPSRRQTTVTVTWFERDRATGLYSKSSERHTEQAYPPEHVSTLLVDAGFEVLAMYDCFSLRPPHEETSRILWVAKLAKGRAHG